MAAEINPASAAAEDGRPFARRRAGGPDEVALWLPEPPRDGDPVYCQGVRVGTFRGTPGPTTSYVETVPTAEMPEALARHVRAALARPAGRGGA